MISRTYIALLFTVIAVASCACPSPAQPPFFAAVRRGDAATVRNLLKCVDPNVRDHLGYTGLHVASGLGDLSVVQALLSAGAWPGFIEPRMGVSPFVKAMQGGHKDVLHALTSDPRVSPVMLDLHSPDLGYTPLMNSIWYKRPAAVQGMLDAVRAGALVNPLAKSHAGRTSTAFTHTTDADNAKSQDLMKASNATLNTIIREAAQANTGNAALKAVIAGSSSVPTAGRSTVARPVGAPYDAAYPAGAAVIIGHTQGWSSFTTADLRPDAAYRRTPIHDIALRGLAYLLDGPNPPRSAPDAFGWTPLHYAAMRGDAAIATWLLKHGADKKAVDLANRTPEMIATASGHASVARLLATGVPVRPSSSTLLGAVRANDLFNIAKHLESFPNVNILDKDQRAPVHFAAAAGHVQATQMLINAGADVHIIDGLGNAPIHYAAMAGDVETVRILLGAGTNINLQSAAHATPLVVAATFGQEAMITELLARGALTALTDIRGQTARGYAMNTRDGRRSARQIQEAEHAVQTANGAKALIKATIANDAKTVAQLIRDGADVNDILALNCRADGNDGHTALLIAGRQGYTDIVKQLRAAGASATIVDGLMRATVGHKASYMGHDDVLAVLTAPGTALELDAQGPQNGYSLLHDCTWHGHYKAVEVMLKAGANPHVVNHSGETPMGLAQLFGYDDIVALYKKYM